MQDSDRHVVTAVLVAHNGARWLPETLKALLTQTRPVQRLVTVDTGSRDRGPAILAEVVGAGNLVTLPETTGYPKAVEAALEHPASALPVPAESSSRSDRSEQAKSEQTKTKSEIEWIWLLHDDCVPAHDALDRLLQAADGDPGIGILGPKLRDLPDRRLLLEIGTTVDGFGRRVTGVERGELDQGQHDGRGVVDVLAVSSAGMLVRREVWDQLGGFDQRLGLFRDDLDLCWRAHAEGHRVVAVSGAIVYHAEASARGLRTAPDQAAVGMVDAVPGVSAARLDRRNALFVLLVNLPFRPMLRTLARNVFGSLVRAAGLALAKRKQAARDELHALADVLLGVRRLWQGRARRRHNRARVYHSVRRLMARRVVLRQVGERIADVMSGDLPWPRRRAEREEADSERPHWVIRLLRNPGVLLVLALSLVSAIACRRLIGVGGQLGGGALVPAWGGVGDLWRQYLSGWHAVGLGSNAGSPPYVGIMALASTLLLGKPWLTVTLLLLGAVPLAGLTAYLAARTAVPEDYRIRSRRHRGKDTGGRGIPAWALRIWAASVYALLPVATGAVAGGRIGTVVVLILLPLIAVLTVRMMDRDRLRARQAAWGAGVLLAVATAFVPLTWVLAAVVGILVWTAFGPMGRGGDLVVALLLPPVLLLPWALGLLLHPSRFLLEAGLHRPGLSDARLPTRQLMFLIPGGPGAPAWWVTAGLLAVAILALPLHLRRNTVLAGWMLALFGLLAAIMVSALQITQGADTAPAWPGVALLFASGGLLLAALATVQRAAELFAGRDWAFRVGGGLVALVAVSAPLTAGWYWVFHGVHGPVERVSAELTPILAGQTEAGFHRERTLVLERRPSEARASYAVLRASAPTLGESEIPSSEAALRRMDSIVAGFAAGHGDGEALARMGVQYVYVPHPGHDTVVAALDSDPDLARLGRSDAFALWRLVPQSGRLLLVDGATVTALPSETMTASVTIPPGDPGRTVLLAEPADGGWQATLNGSQLRPHTVDGWAVGYSVPASGGRFHLDHGMWSRHVWLVVQALLLAIAVLAALPSPEDELARRRPTVRRAEALRTRAAEASAAVGAVARSRAGSGARLAYRSMRDAAERRRQPRQPRQAAAHRRTRRLDETPEQTTPIAPETTGTPQTPETRTPETWTPAIPRTPETPLTPETPWAAESPPSQESSWGAESSRSRESSWSGESSLSQESSWAAESPLSQESSWAAESPLSQESLWAAESSLSQEGSWGAENSLSQESSWSGESSFSEESSWAAESPLAREDPWTQESPLSPVTPLTPQPRLPEEIVAAASLDEAEATPQESAQEPEAEAPLEPLPEAEEEPAELEEADPGPEDALSQEIDDAIVGAAEEVLEGPEGVGA